MSGLLGVGEGGKGYVPPPSQIIGGGAVPPPLPTHVHITPFKKITTLDLATGWQIFDRKYYGNSFTVWIYSLSFSHFIKLILEPKTAEFLKSVDLDEVAHNEPPQLDLHCLSS